MHIDAGAFNQASNNDPVLEFNCTFRYTQEQLAVTDTDPPVGGTFTPPAPGSYTYDVNWNDPVDPASVQTSDLHVERQRWRHRDCGHGDQREHDYRVYVEYPIRRELDCAHCRWGDH